MNEAGVVTIRSVDLHSDLSMTLTIYPEKVWNGVCTKTTAAVAVGQVSSFETVCTNIRRNIRDLKFEELRTQFAASPIRC